MKTFNDFEKIAQRSKVKNRIKLVVLSTLVALASLGIIVRCLTEVASRHGEAVKDTYLLMSEIAYPNISYNNWYFNATSSYTGQFHSDRFKNIDGIEVPYEKMEAYYSIRFADSYDTNVWLTMSSDKRSAYTHSSYYKSPMFYNINHDYTNKDDLAPTNDISLAAQMSNQAIEMAITFDKPYTYQEIQKMIPENLLVNWYWIGSSSDFDTAERTPDKQLGISTYDGEQLNDYSYSLFRKNLEKAVSKGYLDMTENGNDQNGKKQTFNLAEDAQKYLNKNKKLKTAKFSGVILTGRSENFAQLESAKWIFASNIGQSVTIQPYHQLIK